MYQYRMAVCEDDETVREGICGFCDRILTEEQIPHQIAAFSSAEELEACLAENRGSDEPAFHLLILDILMGEKTGMELAMELREEDDATGIIFITGCEEYMGMGYDVQAIQFLVKPLNWEKLKKALLNDWRKKGRQDLLLIKKGRQSLQLPLSGILYAEADGNHGIRIILKEGEEGFPVSLSELEEMASGGPLIRCHNSYLVNMNQVRRLDRQNFILQNGKKIPISRKYLKVCQEKLVSSINR